MDGRDCVSNVSSGGGAGAGAGAGGGGGGDGWAGRVLLGLEKLEARECAGGDRGHWVFVDRAGRELDGPDVARLLGPLDCEV